METAPVRLLRIWSPHKEKGRQAGLFPHHAWEASYCAGAVEPPVAPPVDPELSDGAVGAGVMELLAGGVVGAVVAGGVVLCVVWLSVPPLSLHAARPSKAIAETDARMIFFIVLLLSKLARSPPSVSRIMAAPYFRFVTLGYRVLQHRST